MEWADVEQKLSNRDKLSVLEIMESTGGEPDVVGYDTGTREYIFMDCSRESPAGRRSLCYDRVALDARKENKPKDSVIDMATSMWVSLLTEDEYRQLQSLESFDLKTSSWIVTPANVRKLGWALFCDRRYDMVFTYHNGADSYYAARWWRGSVRI
jgi:hypothetical protein